MKLIYPKEFKFKRIILTNEDEVIFGASGSLYRISNNTKETLGTSIIFSPEYSFHHLTPKDLERTYERN